MATIFYDVIYNARVKVRIRTFRIVRRSCAILIALCLLAVTWLTPLEDRGIPAAFTALMIVAAAVTWYQTRVGALADSRIR